MKKLIITSIAALAFVILTVPALANRSDDRPKGLEDRGPLTKITFIHYKRANARPPWAGGGGGDKNKAPKCYGFLSKGAKWKSGPQDLVINPTGSGLDVDVVETTFHSSAVTWNDAHNGLYSGSYSVDYSANWDEDAPDFVNELSFGDYPQAGVIAVANVWGYFGGPPQSREIVEFDIQFDTDFTWGDAKDNPSVMDLQNIAVHEMGHGWGLADMYETGCNDVTMYGYSTEGETIKRDLHDADINGLLDLYN